MYLEFAGIIEGVKSTNQRCDMLASEASFLSKHAFVVIYVAVSSGIKLIVLTRITSSRLSPSNRGALGVPMWPVDKRYTKF